MSMIHKFTHEDERNWDRWLDPLLFAVLEVPQASTGFSQLLLGRKPWGGLIKENWEEVPSLAINQIQYILDLLGIVHLETKCLCYSLLLARTLRGHTANGGTLTIRLYGCTVEVPHSGQKPPRPPSGGGGRGRGVVFSSAEG